MNLTFWDVLRLVAVTVGMLVVTCVLGVAGVTFSINGYVWPALGAGFLMLASAVLDVSLIVWWVIRP